MTDSTIIIFYTSTTAVCIFGRYWSVDHMVEKITIWATEALYYRTILFSCCSKKISQFFNKILFGCVLKSLDFFVKNSIFDQICSRSPCCWSPKLKFSSKLNFYRNYYKITRNVHKPSSVQKFQKNIRMPRLGRIGTLEYFYLKKIIFTNFSHFVIHKCFKHFTFVKSTESQIECKILIKL